MVATLLVSTTASVTSIVDPLASSFFPLIALESAALSIPCQLGPLMLALTLPVSRFADSKMGAEIGTGVPPMASGKSPVTETLPVRPRTPSLQSGVTAMSRYLVLKDCPPPPKHESETKVLGGR